MGILGRLMGKASQIDSAKVNEEYGPLLIEGEDIEAAFKLVRDTWVFTNKRLIMTDAQGITGKKRDYLTIPYSKITKFSLESSGHFDLDSDLKIWVGSDLEPIKQKITKETGVAELYATLSTFILQ